MIHKIAITGPESSGKSTLSRLLASHFCAPFSDEYAREYLTNIGTNYGIADLEKICQGQIQWEEEALNQAQNLCFFDTDMLVLKIWASFRFGFVPKIIEQAFQSRKYHLTLLCKPDLEWTPDPLRESPDNSERYLLYDKFKSELVESNRYFIEIEGVGSDRFGMAIAAVKNLLQNESCE